MSLSRAVPARPRPPFPARRSAGRASSGRRSVRPLSSASGCSSCSTRRRSQTAWKPPAGTRRTAKSGAGRAPRSRSSGCCSRGWRCRASGSSPSTPTPACCAASRPRSIRGRSRCSSGTIPCGACTRFALPTRPSTSSSAIERGGFAETLARMPGLALPGYDGRGVTIALLDTGVDRTHPFLRGSVLRGIDVVEPHGGRVAGRQPRRARTTRAARHPDGGHRRRDDGFGDGRWCRLGGFGVARFALQAGSPTYAAATASTRAPTSSSPGSSARSTRTTTATRTMQFASRLLGVAAPFAAFADDAAARAVAGALRLQTLVIAPAGNDGAAGPGYGSIAGPSGAPQP